MTFLFHKEFQNYFSSVDLRYVKGPVLFQRMCVRVRLCMYVCINTCVNVCVCTETRG